MSDFKSSPTAQGAGSSEPGRFRQSGQSGLLNAHKTRADHNMAKQMNLQITIRSLLLTIFAISLTACGGKVDCNSSAPKKDALEIIQSNLNNAVWYNEMKLAITGEPKLENIKTLDTQNDGKQSQCVGSYTLTYNEKPHSIDVAYDLTYLEDKKDTEVKVAVRDVQSGLMGLAVSERPIKNGEEKVFDTYNGNLIAVRRWKKGREDGVQEYYDRESKAMVRQYTSVDGEKNGPEKAWGANGKLMTDLTWKNGKATGFATTEGGAGYTIVQLKDGLKEGPQKTYEASQDSEHLAKIENFKNGKLDGLTQKFNEQGKIIFEVLYREGRLAMEDNKTAQTINTCVAGLEADYRKNWSTSYYRPGEMDEHVNYKRPDWESACKEGRLP
ncbi:toxin-antitoxin system YwqK family antitoxin [Ralstonia pseudosolanacearum]|uniref:toxin-antitoxin system YwqK family antitoxin n=1 Tax=Ralstonia pseudosolanacearum TaxID=1310165 RepID=UPI002674B438|nr:hypothetical protein [Ralstonia pseudosolanacearum]